jgi:hypothetical protein
VLIVLIKSFTRQGWGNFDMQLTFSSTFPTAALDLLPMAQDIPSRHGTKSTGAEWDEHKRCKVSFLSSARFPQMARTDTFSPLLARTSRQKRSFGQGIAKAKMKKRNLTPLFGWLGHPSEKGHAVLVMSYRSFPPVSPSTITGSIWIGVRSSFNQYFEMARLGCAWLQGNRKPNHPVP